MLDVAVAYNRYKYIGNEFLTWLWFIIETDQSFIHSVDESITSLHVGNRIVLENRKDEQSEIITIKGDDAGLEEGFLALQKGATVIELNISCKSENQEWKFTLKGESLSFSGLKLPETGPLETKDDIASLVLEKVYFIDKIIDIIELLYNEFLKKRCDNNWKQTIVPAIKKWMYA
ncbi:MAG: hypothetical protein CSA26_09095 [Desulfobacterales bacterium]|nr:MAG: hypothetical protein CSA26_09095 [Desulfobacterales bacterium]